jgi:hypothetical protein
MCAPIVDQVTFSSLQVMLARCCVRFAAEAQAFLQPTVDVKLRTINSFEALVACMPLR